eukprot:CAMPEP_0184352318 /NCGR_PEP_ID=MMETSP1089-20130417/63709_1 /TAXON_ID=38269 ORGANISM="Gloeochaete wittrockiana, Strain SAG46.84" /NCGR_SAMPLE_ID=MMETSP1089 /ASSEMBLY_ACC=CAM_ASM_000445 /LENGTH=288 /DNA_ID=CAMNT_0026686669 /DNA_START=269 /DNA_END=1135 /DNA_ORIENTATION=-
MIAMDVSGTETIEELKQRIEEKEGVPRQHLRLLHSSRSLADCTTVTTCHLQHSDVLEMAIALCGGGLVLIVKSIKGENYTIDIEPSETISSLKQRIRDASAANPDLSENDDLVLTLRGKKLEDDNSLSSYSLKDKSTLMLVRKHVKKTEPEPGPSVLCLNNCGFFGSTASKGYCSKCYKDLKLDEADAVPKPVVSEESASSSSSSSSAVPVEGEPAVIEKVPQADKTRCWKCNIKVGLLGYPCKCEYTFCAKHRYSDKHECTFDYEGTAKERLGKELTTAKQNKVDTL